MHQFVLNLRSKHLNFPLYDAKRHIEEKSMGCTLIQPCQGKYYIRFSLLRRFTKDFVGAALYLLNLFTISQVLSFVYCIL